MANSWSFPKWGLHSLALGLHILKLGLHVQPQKYINLHPCQKAQLWLLAMEPPAYQNIKRSSSNMYCLSISLTIPPQNKSSISTVTAYETRVLMLRLWPSPSRREVCGQNMRPALQLHHDRHWHCRLHLSRLPSDVAFPASAGLPPMFRAPAVPTANSAVTIKD